MQRSSWNYIKNLATEHGVSLKVAGVDRGQRFGHAIDLVLTASGHHPMGEESTCPVCLPLAEFQKVS